MGCQEIRNIFVATAFTLFLCVSGVVADPSSLKPPIKLGAIFSLSGFGAHGGVGEMRAAQLAVEQLNAAGGVGGRKIQLMIEDNQSDLKASVSAFNKLVQVDDIVGLVGPNWSEFSEVVAPLAERAKVPMITPSGVMTNSASRRWVFTLMQPPIETNRALADALMAWPGVTNVLGIVHDNLYFENAWEASKTHFGGKLETREVRITNAQNPDYRSILLRGAGKPGTAIYAALLPGQYAPLLKTRRQLGVTAPVFAVDILYDEGRPTDAETLKDVIGTDFVVLGSEKFHRDYMDKFGEKPLNYGAKAYDAVRLLAEAFVECGRRNYKCIETVDKRGESGHLKFDQNHVIVSDSAISENYAFKQGSWQKIP